MERRNTELLHESGILWDEVEDSRTRGPKESGHTIQYGECAPRAASLPSRLEQFSNAALQYPVPFHPANTKAFLPSPLSTCSKFLYPCAVAASFPIEYNAPVLTPPQTLFLHEKLDLP